MSTFDDRLEAEASKVNWHKVTEAETASFGLALGICRDARTDHCQRRIAWGTATGGVISASVLALCCLFLNVGTGFTVSVIIASQAARVLWLYLKAHRASRDIGVFEQQTIDVAKELATLHPVNSDPLG